MGQAKLRGTYEQRSAQAQQRAAEERAERERQEAEAKEAERQRIAALPPEQQKRISERRHRRHMELAILLGTAAALSEPPMRRGKA